MRLQTEALRLNLTKLRQEKNLSQRAFASNLGMPQSHLSNIESGKTDPGLSTFVDLTRYLGAELMMVPLSLVSTVKALVEPSDKTNDQQKPRWAYVDAENNYDSD